MLLLKSLFKGVSAILFTLSLALSFAPPTANELAVLGEEPRRIALIQRRLAIGALKLDEFGLISTLTGAEHIQDSMQIRASLRAVVDGTALPAGTPDFVAQSEDARIRAFDATPAAPGARFVRVD